MVFAFCTGENGPSGIKVNGKDAGPLEGECFLSGEVDLQPGMNILEIGGKTVRVYALEGYKNDQYRLSKADEKEPLIFRPYRIHEALEDGCEGCHAVSGMRDLTIAMDLKKTCFACHEDFEEVAEGEKKFVHAPVEEGECTSCHDPHYSFRPKLQKAGNVCLECHDAFPEEGIVHRPVKDGECTSCHSPHASAAPKQLVRPGNELCLGCHDKPHVQHRSAEVKGTLTQVPPDFPTEKGQLSCIGCHFPHQSAQRRLFRMPQGKLCQMCHPL